jgi:LysR family glycine cleavage system transcriptional activator
LALVPDFLAAADLAAGRVVEPYPWRVDQEGAWYVVCRPERRADRRIARLRDWLSAEARARLG